MTSSNVDTADLAPNLIQKISISQNNSSEYLCNGNVKAGKRQDYLVWEDYFMSNAILSAMRSKDPNTQVGACIVNDENKIVGIGYNGMPKGCSDDIFPWSKTSSHPLENKYLYVCHAEMNAIINKNSSNVKGCTIYVTLFPCNECAKMIIQSGIKEIVFLSDKDHEKESTVASRLLLDAANVRYRRFIPKQEQITINLNSSISAQL